MPSLWPCHSSEVRGGAMGKNQHVTPHPNGGWQVKGAGNSRATVRTATQKAAIPVAKEIAKNKGGELFIHNKQGQIRMEMTLILPKGNPKKQGSFGFPVTI